MMRWNHAGVGRFGGPRLLASGLLALALLAAFAGVRAQQPARAGLVVVHGDGSAVTRCVEFAESEISGHDLLLRSGLDLHSEASSMGQTVCRIDQEGCTTPQEPCFCGMQDGIAVYWSYWQRGEGDWSYSPLGASNSRVRPGMVDGWIWGSGASGDAALLQSYGFDRVCAEPTATPTATASPTVAASAPTATPQPTVTPTFTPLPAATQTPLPTDTPVATPTESATSTPTHTATASPTPFLTPTASSLPTITPTITLTPTLPPPLIEQFRAQPPVIYAGESVLLEWATRRVFTVTLEMLDVTGASQRVQVSASDSQWITPERSMTMRLTAWQGARSVWAEVEVVVQSEPTATITPSVTPLPPTPFPESAAMIVPNVTPPSAALVPTPPVPTAQAEIRADMVGIGWALLLLVPLVVMGLALSGLALIVLLTWLLSDQYL